MTEHPFDEPQSALSEPSGPRRPRIALMGEFSAGKSTLANMMIGTNPLPVQVVATQLPPVWISHGSAPSVIVDLHGVETPCDLNAVEGIDPGDVAFIRFFCEEKILEHCDIIDMPGISDPNMSSAVWERIMPMADGIVWCSPSTQAWRQSEAAVWSGIDERIKQHSILLLTRGDMLLTPRDKEKVLKRVTSEVGDQFASVEMISLLQASEAGDDAEMWATSGAEPFVNEFLRVIRALEGELDQSEGATPVSFPMPAPETPVQDAPVQETPEATEPVARPRRPSLRRATRRDTAEKSEVQDDLAAFMPKFS